MNYIRAAYRELWPFLPTLGIKAALEFTGLDKRIQKVVSGAGLFTASIYVARKSAIDLTENKDMVGTEKAKRYGLFALGMVGAVAGLTYAVNGAIELILGPSNDEYSSIPSEIESLSDNNIIRVEPFDEDEKRAGEYIPPYEKDDLSSFLPPNTRVPPVDRCQELMSSITAKLQSCPETSKYAMPKMNCEIGGYSWDQPRLDPNQPERSLQDVLLRVVGKNPGKCEFSPYEDFEQARNVIDSCIERGHLKDTDQFSGNLVESYESQRGNAEKFLSQECYEKPDLTWTHEKAQGSERSGLGTENARA